MWATWGLCQFLSWLLPSKSDSLSKLFLSHCVLELLSIGKLKDPPECILHKAIGSQWPYTDTLLIFLARNWQMCLFRQLHRRVMKLCQVPICLLLFCNVIYDLNNVNFFPFIYTQTSCIKDNSHSLDSPALFTYVTIFSLSTGICCFVTKDLYLLVSDTNSQQSIPPSTFFAFILTLLVLHSLKELGSIV